MVSHKRLTILVMLGTCLSQVSCSLLFRPSGPDPEQLLNVVRQYPLNRQPSEAASDPRPAESATAAAAAPLEDSATYRRQIAATFNEWDFAKLETDVREARANKGRLLGGSWKLSELYDVVSQPSAASGATETEWANEFETLKQWKAAQPDSAAAQIALAQADVYYGWSIRGSGYGSSVSSGRYRAFEERLSMASSALVEAARLKEKCPYWYEVMQDVAMGQGWSKPQARELFDQASAYEPTFHMYYREYATYLLPKWYGEPGESAAFAKDAADHVGGRQGDLIYFEIASISICSCESDKPSMANWSWPRIRSGYAALTRLYGTNDVKANRYALMAYAADDKASAREAFAAVGDDSSEGIWRSRQSFEDTKLWAKSQ
jgi:hypothetical protein